MPSYPAPDRAPGAPSLSVRVLSVPVRTFVMVRFLGPLYGLHTHWHAGRSVPCPGPVTCPPPIHKAGVISKFYAAVESWSVKDKLWKPWCLEATEALEEQLRGRELTGEVWCLERREAKKSAGELVGTYCETQKLGTYPPEFDFEPVLLRLYRVATLNLGVPSLIPAKLTLKASEGPEPQLPPHLRPRSRPGGANGIH